MFGGVSSLFKSLICRWIVTKDFTSHCDGVYRKNDASMRRFRLLLDMHLRMLDHCVVVF